MSADSPLPPLAEKRPVTLGLHGRERQDPYAWLKDDNWQEVMRRPEVLKPDIRAYLEAENAYTAAALADTEALQESLFAELKGRIKQDDSSVPAPDGPWAYYQRYETGGEHPVICRRPRDGGAEGGGEEQVLYDANAAAKGEAYFKLASAEHSPDHARLVTAADVKGSEYFTAEIRELESGEVLPERLENTDGNLVWGNDGRTLYYTVLDDNHRPWRVYRHRLGEDPAQDDLVYEEKDPGFFVGLDKTESGRFVVILAHDHTTLEAWLVEAGDPAGAARLVAARERDVEYSVLHHGARLLILTNAEGAEDFKVVEAPVEAPERNNWRDLVPHRAGRLIVSLLVFKRHLVRLERVEGLPRLAVEDLESGESHLVAFEEAAYSLGVIPGYEYDATTLRFVYSSLTTPAQTFDYDMDSRARKLLKQQVVPSGHDPEDYRAERLMAKSPDGEEVPVSLLYHRDTPLDGSAPLLLYGYGSYGMTVPAAFSTSRLSLVDRGFVYAIAHIRGGMDKGFAWYRHGKLMEKKNTFFDFIAAAEHLIEAGYTRAGEIAIHGGSAGGMLVGAAVNLRPELFKAAVAEVPFVDVLTTMSDKDLPLTPPEWPEWGNPIESAEAYDYIASYSPYDNVAAKAYPNILATGGLTDPRVTYWEPAKWVARLRARKTGDKLLLLKTYMEAGHGGSAGRFEKLREVALVYAFLLKVFGRAR
ncbi:MAG: S9 family peptidase [Rhodovibrionaceae bacterium]